VPELGIALDRHAAAVGDHVDELAVTLQAAPPLRRVK
jgi:hypothetical protein